MLNRVFFLTLTYRTRPLLWCRQIGSVNRIPFPVAIRSSHGYWFAVFPILSRAIIALFWVSTTRKAPDPANVTDPSFLSSEYKRGTDRDV